MKDGVLGSRHPHIFMILISVAPEFPSFGMSCVVILSHDSAIESVAAVFHSNYMTGAWGSLIHQENPPLLPPSLYPDVPLPSFMSW